MPPAKPPDTTSIQKALIRGIPAPLDVAVKVPEARRESQITKPHVMSCHLPEGCFVEAGGGVFVSSPELCFFQMARELSLIRLIELGFEFCGTYSLAAEYTIRTNPVAAKVGLNVRRSLTTKKKLLAFSSRIKGERGTAKALRALRYISDGSASPMETILVMFLSLPCKLGGYGLPMPELNARIDPVKAAKKSASKDYYFCDLYWPDANVPVEYDSDTHHTGAERIASDNKRRNSLTVAGVNVITVTNQLIRNRKELEKVAKQLAAITGKRLRTSTNPKFFEAQNELRTLLP